MIESNGIPVWVEDSIDELLETLSFLVDSNRRPASEVILSEKETLEKLKVSKRTLASWRAEGVIIYSKIKGVIFYRLSDILNLIKANQIRTDQSTSSILGKSAVSKSRRC